MACILRTRSWSWTRTSLQSCPWTGPKKPPVRASWPSRFLGFRGAPAHVWACVLQTHLAFLVLVSGGGPEQLWWLSKLGPPCACDSTHQFLPCTSLLGATVVLAPWAESTLLLILLDTFFFSWMREANVLFLTCHGAAGLQSPAGGSEPGCGFPCAPGRARAEHSFPCYACWCLLS